MEWQESTGRERGWTQTFEPPKHISLQTEVVFLYQCVIAWRQNIVFIVIDVVMVCEASDDAGHTDSLESFVCVFVVSDAHTRSYHPHSSLVPHWDEMKMAFVVCMLMRSSVWLFHTSDVEVQCQTCNCHHDSEWLLGVMKLIR